MEFIMYKIIDGKKAINYTLNAISELHAQTVAEDFYNKNGLIGRYYCETETGKTFIIP